MTWRLFPTLLLTIATNDGLFIRTATTLYRIGTSIGQNIRQYDSTALACLKSRYRRVTRYNGPRLAIHTR